VRKIDIQSVEDHPAIQLAIRMSLNAQHYNIRHCAASVEEAEQQAASSPIDVVILDLNLPGLSGETLLSRYRKTRPNTRVLIYSATSKMNVAHRCMESGAFGFVRKGSSMQELMTALDKVAINNVRHIPQELIEFTQSNASEKTVLTDREKEVARLVATGCSNRLIADQLGISERTVNIHRSNLMRKIDAHSASEVTLFAVDTGLVAPEDIPSGRISR